MSLADQASLLLIPTGYKSQKVYSIFPTDGDGDFDFSRSSSATRIAKNGLITTVAANVPRLNYPLIDGVVNGCPSLLLENSATNLLPYSEDFSNAAWTKFNSTAIANSIISPDGSLSATKLTEDTSSATHRIYDTIVVSFTGVVCTQSIFAKSDGSGRYLRMFRGSGTYNNAVFDLDNGVVFSQGGSNLISTKIEKYPNGWYKCSSTFTTQFGNVATYYGIQNGNLDSYTGDGTSGIYVWGAQLEEGSFPTSYIKSNSGSTTTRSAETCNGAGDATTFNDSEGVLMLEFKGLANDSYRLISLSDGTNGNNVRINLTPTANQIIFEANSANVLQSAFTYNGVDILLNNKIIIKYKNNDYGFWVNGFKVGTDTIGDTPIGLDTINFDRGTGGNPFYGNTKQLQYYNSALTDSELEQLTSWTSFSDMANGQLYTIE